MKDILEKLDSIFEVSLVKEGGASGATRYSSELGVLASYAGKPNVANLVPSSPNKYFDASKLLNPKQVFGDIKNLVSQEGNFDPKVYKLFIERGNKLKLNTKNIPKQVSWAAGQNIGDETGSAADIIFVNNKIAGVSVKVGLATLGNFTPSLLGIGEDKGDAFEQYAKEEFNQFKTAVISDALSKGSWGTQDGKYTFKKVKPNKFILTVGDKQTAPLTKEEIINGNVSKKFLSVFGAYLVVNKNKFTKFAKNFYEKVGSIVYKIVDRNLGANISSALNLMQKPYYYLSDKAMYRVKSIKEAGNLDFSVSYNYNPNDVTGVQYIISFNNKESKKVAQVTLYMRYANRVFASSPTLRVQNYKGLENIIWEKL